MTIIDAILYGVVQGITEYLPVSSSAHLILLPKFRNIEDPGLAFDVFLHMGTLAATVLYFKKDWLDILHPTKLKSIKQNIEGTTLRNIVLATLPALLVGALLHSIIKTVFRGEGIVVITLCVGGALLWLVDRWSTHHKSHAQVSQKDAIFVGLFQCLALVPGMSRSGSTMMGARFLGLSRESAARFSFLLSAPVTLAAIVFEFRHFGELAQSTSIGWVTLLVAGLSAFVSGWLAIDVLLRFVSRIGFFGFGVCRIALALLVYFVFRPF